MAHCLRPPPPRDTAPCPPPPAESGEQPVIPRDRVLALLAAWREADDALALDAATERDHGTIYPGGRW